MRLSREEKTQIAMALLGQCPLCWCMDVDTKFEPTCTHCKAIWHLRLNKKTDDENGVIVYGVELEIIRERQK